MAKKVVKKTTKKKVAKKTTKKPSKATPKKKVVKKPVAKKVTKKTTKKTTKATTKKVTKKTTTNKPAAKKPATKPANKTTKKTTKKTIAKSKVTKKPTPKPASKKPDPKASTKPGKGTPAANAEGDKKPPVKKFRARARKRVPADYAPPPRPLLLGPGSKLASGPIITSSKRPKKKKEETKLSKRTKTPFTPKQLDMYKLILLNKRAELVGDVEHLEDEALRSSTGETQTASNAAEFGSESFEQGLNLNLAAADRALIVEIDDALTRIKDRTYGLCIESHQPIKVERLAELPWAKYSIETARKLDQRFHR